MCVLTPDMILIMCVVYIIYQIFVYVQTADTLICANILNAESE